VKTSSNITGIKATTKINRIDIKEVREFGYLQELNRRFLHPLGLALEVIVDDDGNETLGGIWDYRDDEEGIIFNEIDTGKAANVFLEQRRREIVRQQKLGYTIQPV